MSLLLDTFIKCETCHATHDKSKEIEELKDYPGIDSPLYPKMLQAIIDKCEKRVCELHNIRKQV